MSKIKHIFFDLDKTLWDFDANAHEAFHDIFEEFEISKTISDADKFVETYHIHNEKLWGFYRKGLIKKEFLRTERFNLTLKDFGINDHILASELGDKYLTIAPTKTNLVPFTFEILSYLKLKKYELHILTNGFKEVQFQKLKNCDILKFFTKVICAEDAGSQKPKKEIFEYALSTNNAKKEESIMIGDDLEVDIIGASKFGMQQVYYNPNNIRIPGQFQPSYSIQSLEELKSIF
jgi:putative hydrolase of the HAD superfamily